MVGGQKTYLDRRHLLHPQRSHTVKIGLHNTTTIDGDRLTQRSTQPVERRALHLILGAAGIDNLAADIGDDLDVIELDLA